MVVSIFNYNPPDSFKQKLHNSCLKYKCFGINFNIIVNNDTVKYLKVSTIIRTYKYTILILIAMFVDQKEHLCHCQTSLKSQKCNFPINCP